MQKRLFAHILCTLLCIALLCGMGMPAACASESVGGRRALSQSELDAINSSLDPSENGFFVTSYSCPEEIDWAEVLYNGAGMKVQPNEAQIAGYTSYMGEIMTSLVCIPKTAVEHFVLEKTGTEYRAARRPLFWYLSEDGLYMTQHGDTNAQMIHINSGWVDGAEYELCYTRSDWQNYRGERPFVMRVRIEDGSWLFRSNLPADAPVPVPLLNIRFAETREEAEALGASQFVDVASLPSEEPAWCWAVITALEDNIRLSVDRAFAETPEEEYLAEVADLQIPDINLCSGVLNRGQCFAVWVNQAWHPRIRLMATMGSFYGEYWFGEENWLHLDSDLDRWLIGHDLSAEGRGCEPRDEADLVNFLADGPWAWINPDTGKLLASVRFYDYRSMLVETMDGSFQLFLRYGRIYAGDQESPDLLQLEKYTEEDARWNAIPSWFGRNLGDYLISAIQMDGEQILYLTQANNGDAVLNYILPGAGEYQREFCLIRYRGTAVLEGQG